MAGTSWANKSATIATILGCLACDDTTAPETPLSLPVMDRVVFQSDRDDPHGDIYAMTLDGADVRRLTSSSDGETCPSLSPDGNWIAFYSYVGDPANSATVYKLRLMHANGTDSRVVADIGMPRTCPHWSRSSDAIEVTYFEYPSASANGSSERTQVFRLSGQEVGSFQWYYYSIAAFSADGTALLGEWSMCSQNGCTRPDLAVRNLDGSGNRWLTGTITAGTFQQDGGSDPSVSPDGATVAFICNNNVDAGLRGLCTIKWDGTGKTLIASDAYFSPRFSPDGTRIAFVCGSPPLPDLCVRDTNGGNLLRRTMSEGVRALIWTIDGRRLLFGCSGATDICSVAADLTDLTNLTLGRGNNANPSVPGSPFQ